ncbi:unnamed protein product, partial [Ixodes pacificus]
MQQLLRQLSTSAAEWRLRCLRGRCSPALVPLRGRSRARSCGEPSRWGRGYEELMKYDLRQDLRGPGRGSCSMRYALVQPTMVRQHSSWSDSTAREGGGRCFMPFLRRAMRDSSTKDSVTLKSHRGLTSKKAMPCLWAYSAASCCPTSRRKARCSRLPIKILEMPGAALTFSTSWSQRPRPSKDQRLVMS